MCKHALVFIKTMLLATVLVFSSPVFAEGNGWGVTVDTGTNASSHAKGGKANAWSSGSNAGSGYLSQGNDHKGANVGADFESGFNAEASRDSFGSVSSGGQSSGGFTIGLDHGGHSQSYNGSGGEQAEAGADGEHSGADTWNNGNMNGSAWMTRGHNYGESNAETGHAAQDWGHENAYSNGSNNVSGGVSVNY